MFYYLGDRTFYGIIRICLPDMFRSFTIPYVIIAGWYYISLFQEIKKAE